MQKESNILLVVSSELIREGLRSWVDRYLNHVVIHKEMVRGEEALVEGKKDLYDLIILDNHLPGIKGLEVAIILRESGIETPILLLSRLKDGEIIDRILEMGINGVIPRDLSAKQFIDAMVAIRSGKTYGPRYRQLQEEPLCEKLSYRERQVFYMLGRGYKCSEIARKINISRGSIDTYRKRIFEKMGFENNMQLIRYLVKHDLDTRSLSIMLSGVE